MNTGLKYLIVAAALLTARGACAQSAYWEAERLFKQSEYRQALTMYQAARVIEQDSTVMLRIDNRIRLAERCVEIKDRADRLYGQERWWDEAHGDAVKLYRELLSLNPSDSHAAARTAEGEGRIAEHKRQVAERERQAARDADDEDWRRALAKDSTSAFPDYIAKHPDGLHTAEAKRLIELAGRKPAEEENFWNETLRMNTEAAYLAYIYKYPDGRHPSEARREIDRLADDRLWREATERDSEQAYLDYLALSKRKDYESHAGERLRHIRDSLTQTARVDSMEAHFNRRKYWDVLREMKELKRDMLPSALQAKVDYYGAVSEYRDRFRNNRYASLEALNSYLTRYPGTPYLEEARRMIRQLRTRKKLEKAVPYTQMGVLCYRVGGSRMWTHTFPLSFMIRNGYDRINILTGVEYSYYRKLYEDTWLATQDAYRISAHQFSIPVTLKINLERKDSDYDSDYNDGHLYLSVTGLYNYNFMGKCFRVHDAELVNRTTHSGMISFGYESILDDDGSMNASIFFRKDFRPVFAGKEAVYRHDDHLEINNYKNIDRAIGNTVYIGISFAVYMTLK